jgi:hypothetical protein
MAPIHRTSHPCPACGSAETFRVAMTLGGSPASFCSCPMCEWKGWEHNGQSVSLESVLDLVATR